MDIDDEELRLLQGQRMLLFSGQVWSRSDDEVLLDSDNEDDEERHVLIEDSDEQSQLSLVLEQSPPASSLPGRADASSAFSQDRARDTSDSEHLIESEQDEGDADVEDDLELLEPSEDEDGLVLSDEDKPQRDAKGVSAPPSFQNSHNVLQEALDGFETTKLVIPDGVTGAERRQLIIQGLQNLALSFLLQLTLSTTLACGTQESASDSDASEAADASDDNNAELGNAMRRKKKKTAPRPSYKPIKMRVGQRKISRSTKTQLADTDDEEDSAKMEAVPGSALRSVIFPTSRHASRTIAHTLRVAEIAKDALEADRTITLRDIYYRDVALFGTQQKVNSVALTLANTLGVRRSDLNIVAASKGLAHGHLKFIAKDGSETDCFSKEGCLIPPKEEIASVGVPSDLRFILIVEKDAVFRPLASGDFSNDPALGKSVLITGKGYPDMSTRELAHRLGEELQDSVPILCLVDGDPHGIEIFLNYRDGSKVMQGDEGNLTCPRIQWLGVSAEDMREAGVDREYLLPLTERDVSKTYKMLDRDNLDAELQRELCHMLHSRKKAEIQILGQVSENGNSTTDGLLEYLRRKIVRFL